MPPPEATGSEPPVDPRMGWQVPPFGELPTVARVDELVTRVLAPNPSPMTLDGTNTYLITVPGSGDAVVVDPGPGVSEHLHNAEAALAGIDAHPSAIVVTHHHADHAEAASAWSHHFGCPVVASSSQVAGSSGRVVGDGDRIVAGGGLSLDVVATPGHTRDHISLRLPTGALLTGDHVLGRGTSVVAHPDGDLAAYLESLRVVLALGPHLLLPGHGPEMAEDPMAVLRYYRDHRAFREGQIMAVLSEAPATPRQLVERIYVGVDQRLWPAAEASTRATLAALEQRGVVLLGDDSLARLIEADHIG